MKQYALVHASDSMKRYHDHLRFYKGKHLIGVAYSFRGLVHYHLGRTWHAGRHDTREELRVLHIDLQSTGSELYPLGMAQAYVRPQSPPPQ